MQEILRILFTSALSFIALFIIAKLTGKKQIAQLEFIDYIMGISIGSIAAQMAVDPEIPFYHFLIAMAVYTVVDLAITFVTRKSIKLREFIKGKPLILIENGKLNYKNLQKSKLDISELFALCREKDYFELSTVAYCVFETNGQISVLPKAADAPPVASDFDIEKPLPALSTEVILDGRIIEKALKSLNKDSRWLLEKLSLSRADEVKKIAVASYDEQTDTLDVHMK